MTFRSLVFLFHLTDGNFYLTIAFRYRLQNVPIVLVRQLDSINTATLFLSLCVFPEGFLNMLLIKC